MTADNNQTPQIPEGELYLFGRIDPKTEAFQCLFSICRAPLVRATFNVRSVPVLRPMQKFADKAANLKRLHAHACNSVSFLHRLWVFLDCGDHGLWRQRAQLSVIG